jgi:hypothetical protein
VSRNFLIAIILVLWTALVIIAALQFIPPKNSIACTFPPGGRTTCVSDLGGVEVTRFEDGSIKITGCISGELCED